MSPLPLPLFVALGEALTDLVEQSGAVWRSHNGGAPWNVARSMSGLGVASAFGGGISRCPFGDSLLLASRAAGLDERFIQRFADRPPLLAFVHQTQPPAYVFVGNHNADLHFDPALLPAGWRSAVRWALFGGISLAREPLASRLVGLATQLKAAGIHICVDPNHRNLMDSRCDTTLRQMCALADVIKVSTEDLQGLFRSADTDRGLAQLRAWARPGTRLMLTHGADGALLFAGSEQWQATPPPIVVADSVGAGDASVAGLLHSLIVFPGQSRNTTCAAPLPRVRPRVP